MSRPGTRLYHAGCKQHHAVCTCELEVERLDALASGTPCMGAAWEGRATLITFSHQTVPSAAN